MAKNMTVLETLRQERGRAVPGGSLKHHSDPLNKKNRAKQQGLYTQRIEGKVAACGSLKHHSDPLNKKNRVQHRGLYNQRREGRAVPGGSLTLITLAVLESFFEITVLG